MLYGFVMALTFVLAAQLGIIAYSSRESLVIAMFAMDFVWGIIDMVLFYRIDIFSQYRAMNRLEILYNCNDRNCHHDEIRDEIENSVFGLVDRETREKAVELLKHSKSATEDELRFRKRVYLFDAVTAFLATVLASLPAIACVLLIDDYNLALFWASFVSSVALFFIGYSLSPWKDLKGRIVTGAMITLTGMVLTVFAAYFGG
ncbi:MAG: hypothetical protein MJZ68_01695 [archaeon]|nr:hypothetical protein [archaeon]